MTSYWNYRLVRLNEEDVEVCEAYYDDQGMPDGYVRRAPGGSYADEIEKTLNLMLSALTKSVLEVRDGQVVDTESLLARSAPDDRVEPRDPHPPAMAGHSQARESTKRMTT